MKQIFLLLFVLFGNFAISQEKHIVPKSNQFVFGEFFIGGSFLNIKGVALGGSVNYQSDENLYTLRSILVEEGKDSDYKKNIFPNVDLNYSRVNSVLEFSLLYGKRYVFQYTSLSASLGISIYQFKDYLVQNGGYYSPSVDSVIGIDSKIAAGVPFEINFKFFNDPKKRSDFSYRKKGSSGKYGIKFFGNISEHNYMGLGLTLGVGLHR